MIIDIRECCYMFGKLKKELRANPIVKGDGEQIGKFHVLVYINGLMLNYCPICGIPITYEVEL